MCFNVNDIKSRFITSLVISLCTFKPSPYTSLLWILCKRGPFRWCQSHSVSCCLVPSFARLIGNAIKISAPEQSQRSSISPNHDQSSRAGRFLSPLWVGETERMLVLLVQSHVQFCSFFYVWIIVRSHHVCSLIEKRSEEKKSKCGRI